MPNLASAVSFVTGAPALLLSDSEQLNPSAHMAGHGHAGLNLVYSIEINTLPAGGGWTAVCTCSRMTQQY